MVDVLHFRRSARKPASWLQALNRAVRSTVHLFRHYGGFCAVAALVVGAVLLQTGDLQPGLGTRTTKRFMAVAVDGDSIRAAGERIRLMGIDAPELNQTCTDEHGGTWGCGRQAHALLRAIVSRGALTCSSSSHDIYGRMLATCSVSDVGDIGDAMVRAGYAVSFRSIGYWTAEFEARRHKRGIWRGTFDRPQDWRRRHPRQ